MARNKIFLTIMVLGLLVLSSCGISNDPNATPSKTIQNGMDVGKNSKYAELFKKDTVLDISINIDPSYLDTMYQDPDSGEYYSANITVGDIEVKNSGFRISGNTSLDGGEASANRYSFKIKFDKFVPKQKLNGLDELSLSNVSRDPSYMREYLMCEAFAKLELPAPLAAYANVSINGNKVGLYIAIESIDDSFLKRAYGNNDGNLYKALSNATLQDLNSLSLFEQKNGKDESKADLQSLIEKLAEMPLEEKGDIESILDVDSVLKYIAINTLLGNYDSYLGASCENFYLVANDSKFSIIPWDFNLAFGAQKKDNGVSVTVPLDNPVFRCELTQRPLVLMLLSVPEYYEKYLGYVETCKGFLSNLETRVTEIDAVISEHVQNDPSKFYSFENYKANIGLSETGSSGVIAIVEYVSLRISSIS